MVPGEAQGLVRKSGDVGCGEFLASVGLEHVAIQAVQKDDDEIRWLHRIQPSRPGFTFRRRLRCAIRHRRRTRGRGKGIDPAATNPRMPGSRSGRSRVHGNGRRSADHRTAWASPLSRVVDDTTHQSGRATSHRRLLDLNACPNLSRCGRRRSGRCRRVSFERGKPIGDEVVGLVWALLVKPVP
jgi:hypothetical protein